jgi:electron transport complex, RnfABCDGE type, E subunit
MNVTLKSYLEQLRNGVLDNNPIIIQLLGTCPTLATTTSVRNAVGMGIATTVALTFSNFFISLLRKFIPREIRIAAYIIVISGFVTAIELLMKAYLPDLSESLGVFIPLIVVNCIILARAESYASKNKVLPSLVDGISMGLGFTIALTVIGSIREILGAGTWLGIDIFGAAYQPALIFIMPSGAFITLGCIIAVVNKIKEHMKNKAEEADIQ